jgi:hypothetical protein
MTMKRHTRSRWTLLAVAAVAGSALELGLFVGDAHAIIGRPLTPFSYAGVARRTTRRAVVFGAAAARPYAYPVPVPAPVPAPAPYPVPVAEPAPYPEATPYYW